MIFTGCWLDCFVVKEAAHGVLSIVIWYVYWRCGDF